MAAVIWEGVSKRKQMMEILAHLVRIIPQFLQDGKNSKKLPKSVSSSTREERERSEKRYQIPQSVVPLAGAKDSFDFPFLIIRVLGGYHGW
jgi:hypothetical protein